MATDFSSLLSQNLDNVKRPPVKPPGTYHAMIKEHKFDLTSQKKTPFCRLTFNNVQPGVDVDQSLLVIEGEQIDLSKWTPSTRGLSDFYLGPDSVWKLKELIEELGISTTGRTLQECIPEMTGQRVLLTVSMKQTEDGKGFFNQIDSVAADK